MASDRPESKPDDGLSSVSIAVDISDTNCNNGDQQTTAIVSTVTDNISGSQSTAAGSAAVETNIAISDAGNAATAEDNSGTEGDVVDGHAAQSWESSVMRTLRHSCNRQRRGRRSTGARHSGFMVTRLRDLQSRHGEWTCFLCCHVTTGTGIIGAWHVLLHVLALLLLSLAFVYPGLVASSSRYTRDYVQVPERQDVQAVNCSRMPCSLATQHGLGTEPRVAVTKGFGGTGGTVRYPHVAPDFPLALGHLLSTHQLNSEAISVAVIITLCTLMVTLLLLHGLQKKQQSHLLPFFFLQVFDFCISSMTMVSYLSYLPNLRHLLQETPAFPFRDQLLSMQTNCLTFAVMIIFISTFMVKAYCINIVWRCYKYLQVNYLAATANSRSLMTATSAGPAPDHCMHWLAHQDNRTKASGVYPEPPPSYDMAMAAGVVTGPPYGQAGGEGADVTTTATTAAAAAPVDESPLLPRYEDAVANNSNSNSNNSVPHNV